jgi:hypothetical protein
MFALAAVTSDSSQTSETVDKGSGGLIEKVSRLVDTAVTMMADK